MKDWWNNIIPPVIAFYLLGLIHANQYAFDWKQFFLLIVLLVSVALFGFYLGEWSDISDDRNAGKLNQLAEKSVFFRVFVFLIIIIGLASSAFVMELNRMQYALIFVQLALFYFYSLYPFRFKYNRVLSMILDSLYSGTIMYLFAYSLGETYLSKPILIVITSWGVFRGIRNYLIHTINDAQQDAKIGVKSFGNTFNKDSVVKFLQYYVLPVEVISFLLIIYFGNTFFVAFLILYIISFMVLWLTKSNENKREKIPFIYSINIFHEVFLPIILVSFFALKNPLQGIMLLGLLFLLFKDFRLWASSIFKRLIKIL